MTLGDLRDGVVVAIELRGVAAGGGDGWSEGFLRVHAHKTYETAAAFGALNWGGHQITSASRASVESLCRGERLARTPGARGNGSVVGGGEDDDDDDGGGGGAQRARTSMEAHSREVSRFLFKAHLFGSGRDVTLRSESTGTLVTTFTLGVRFERRRVVAWHRTRSSKLLTAAVSAFTPPEGGAWEEFSLRPAARTPLGLRLCDHAEATDADEFVMCRPRDGTYWGYNLGGDDMIAFTRDLKRASLFRVHRAFPGDEDSHSD